MRRFSELVVARYPEKSIRVVNRGAGGAGIRDLRRGWEDQVLSLKPDWLTIGVGINDVHGLLFGPEPRTDPDEFRRLFTAILETMEAGLRQRTVLLDPFYIHRKSLEPSRENAVMESLAAFIEVVHGMHERYGTRLVQTHQVFQDHLGYRDPGEFCLEPVHPNALGHHIIAEELAAVLSGNAGVQRRRTGSQGQGAGHEPRG